MNQFISDKLRRKVGLHNLMLYSYIMCSNRRVTVLVFFCLLITFWGIKFIILKLKLEINAWSFIFLFIYIFFYSLVFKKLVWILLLYFWNFKDLSFDSGIQSLIWRGESNFYSSFILCLIFLLEFCSALVESTKFPIFSRKKILVMSFVCWMSCIYIFLPFSKI